MYTYIYNINSEYKWTPQEVIDLYILKITFRGPGQTIRIYLYCYSGAPNIYF